MSVYFARVRGYVKIGYSANPYSRVATITAGTCIKPDDVTYGDEVDLLGWVPGDRKVERATHRRFATLNVTGEWFWDDDAYDELIVADEFGVPFHDLPHQVVHLMGQYPTIPRAQVVEVFEADYDKRLADPNSQLSQISGMFGGPEFVERVKADSARQRAAERAQWRGQHQQLGRAA